MRAPVIGWVASGVMFAASQVAWAQDYTVTTATGQLETRPIGATLVNVANNISVAPFTTAVTLPFEFPYFGRVTTKATVSAAGYLIPDGPSSLSGNPLDPVQSHGQDATSGAFPYSINGAGGANGSNVDGLAAPMWQYFSHVNDGNTNPGYVYSWTTGTAPARHFVVSWENVQAGATGFPRVTVQIHLYEASGRIVFAYSNPSGGYTGAAYPLGLDAPGDSRYVIPSTIANSRTNTGYPGSDFVFDPRAVSFSGRLLFDKLVSDSSGIGNSVIAGQNLGNFAMEFRRDGGIVASRTTTAADGTFSSTVYGAAASSSGTLTVLAQNSACRVTTVQGAVTRSWDAVANLSYATGGDQGTLTLGAVGDSNGTIRAPFNVARACEAARTWCQSQASTTLAPLEIALDDTSGVATAYAALTPSGAPLLTIAGRQAANPDEWDDAVVTRMYGRLVLATIAALPTTSADHRFDAVSDTQNAIAEAFGLYLWTVVSGSSQAIDGLSASSATVYDLESPAISVTTGPDVVGCMAGVLYDLLDPANETIDTVDGTSVPARVFQIVDAFTVCPTASTFLQAWVDAGYDSAAITRVQIGHGVLADDGLEPDDDRTEAASLGSAGVKRTGLVLNRYSEDWYSVTLAAAAPALLADVSWDRVTLNTAITLEVRDAAGTLLATGTSATATSAVHATTNAVPQGTYKIGVRYTSGVAIPAYTVQVYRALSMTSTPLPDWTVGRPYDADPVAAFGVPPYTIATSNSSPPPGIGFNPLDLHAVGTPSTVGSFPVTVQLTDAGSPANVVVRTRTVVIHDVLTIPVAAFVGFPLTKSADTTLPTTGGTPPFTLAMTSGELPSGLVFDPNSFHVTGTITAGPSSAFELDGADVAGSTDHVAVRAVVAHPASGKNVPADLVTGVDACGWWFDAVEGSKVSFTVATTKKRAKRVLAGTVLAPDRSAVLTGKIKVKLGSLAGSGFVCPASGRYYVIASSEDGDATQLLANVKVVPPKSGKAKPVTISPSDTTTLDIGALPGATLTLKVAGQKSTTLVAKVVSVTDPTGTPVSFAPFLKTTATGGTLTMPLATGGTWTVVLGATSTSGVPGKFSYSYAIKQPKGVTYSAD